MWLATPYWSGDQRRAAWFLTAGLVSAVVAQVLLQLPLNIWSGDFFNALEARDGRAIVGQVAIFAVLACGSVAAAAYLIWLKMAIQGAWRRELTRHLVDRWLADGTHYKLRFLGDANDNPDQRIAADVQLVTEGAVDFAAGILDSILLLFGFFAILWSLSGTLSVTVAGYGLALPGDLIVAAFAYAGMGTAATHLLGRPLVRINERRHAREGDFRFALMGVRENSESIALMRGGRVERRALRDAMERLLEVWRALMINVRRLTWVTSGYTVAAPVVPLLVAARTSWRARCRSPD